MRCILVISYLLLDVPGVGTRLAAQRITLPYVHYTIRDGLAQQQVRTFWEDKAGYIWIGTQGGLSRFDGRTLVSPRTEDGPSGKHIFSIRETPDGSIWYRSGDSVYCFDGRHNSSLPVSDSFWQALPTHLWVLIPEHIPQRLGGRFRELRNLRWGEYQIITDTAGAAVIIDFAGRRCHRILEHCETAVLPDDFPYGGTADHTFRYYVSRNNYYTWTGRKLECVAGLLPGTDSPEIYHHLAPAVLDLETGGKKSYWYKSGSQYQRLEPGRFNRIDKIFADSQGRIFIATDEGLAVYYTDGPQRMELPLARYPWAVLPDGKGNVWISSLGEGFIRVDSAPHINRYFPLPGSNQREHQVFPGKLRGVDGTLLFGAYKGFYYLRNAKPVLFRLGESVEAIAWDAQHSQYLVAGSKIFLIDSLLKNVCGTILLPRELTLGDGLSTLATSSNGSIWAGGRGGIGHIKANRTFQKIHRFTGPCIGLLTDERSVLWAGCGDGLFWYNTARDTFIRVLPEVIKSAVNSITLLPASTLAIATDMELMLLDIQVPERVRLTGYWSNTNGFQLLEASENGSSFDGRYLWIPAGTGIQRLPVPLKRNFAGNSIRLRVDRIGTKPCLLRDSLPVDTVWGSMTQIGLSIVNSSIEKYEVEYRFGHGSWIATGNRLAVSVTGLEHGRNTIQFRVKIFGLEERYWPTAFCVLEAELPLYERKSFQYAFGIAILLAIIGLVIGAYQRFREANLKRLLLQSNLSAALAHLNPHILFNLLASLQNTILNRGKEEASAHLVRLSGLFREVLELSMQKGAESGYPFPVITVDREINFLQNYLSLEAMQYAPPFLYMVEDALSTPKEALIIPPLLVQPLVENAILHGVRPLSGRTGEIKVRFEEDDINLIIAVEDNGVGFGAESTRQSQHRSRGGQLLRERLEYLNNLRYRTKWSIKPRIPQGTIAEIRIKKMYAHHSD